MTKKIAYLDRLIEEKQRALKSVPKGKLKGSRHNKGWQYYRRENSQDRNGKYIRESERPIAVSLGQKEYDQLVLKASQTEIRSWTRLKKLYDGDSASACLPENVYFLIPDGMRCLVTPFEEPPESYVKRWQEQVYSGNPYGPPPSAFRTKKNEFVRSKSELLIANMLTDHKIPYLYEKPLLLKSGRTVYPDFTVLDMKIRN